MFLVVVSWVRDEADIIEAFVRYHATIADRIVVVDHRSQDNTLEILRALQAEGLPLDVHTNSDLSHRQPDAIMEVLHAMADSPPQWILPLDADEFLVSDRGSPRAHVQSLHSNVWKLPWRTYIPTPEDPLHEKNILARVRHRRCTEQIVWSKVLLPGDIAVSSHYEIPFGNHGILDRRTGCALIAEESPGLCLAHFPVRSPKQIMKKVFNGWLSFSAYSRKMVGSTFHWKALFDECKTGTPPDALRLKQMALEYAGLSQWNAAAPSLPGASLLSFGVTSDVLSDNQEIIVDPVPHNFSVRFPQHMVNPWTVLADSAEAFANAHAQATSRADAPLLH